MTTNKLLFRRFLVAATLAVSAHYFAEHHLPLVRGVVDPRFCFTNQKVVAGALELYCLDHNCSVTCLDARLFATLVKTGYLQTVPDDPGFGPNTASHLRLTESGAIYCTMHGFRSADHYRAPREQLWARGIRDPNRLAAASPFVHHRFRGGDGSHRWRNHRTAVALCIFVIVFLLTGQTLPHILARREKAAQVCTFH